MSDDLVFYYDFSSPYAYLGATQVERVAREQGARVRWRPILVGALFNQIGTPTVPLAEFPAPKRAYVARDLAHWASHWQVPLQWPSRFPMRTVAPLRLALATEAAGGDIAAVSLRLFRAYWVEDRDISDPAVLREFGDLSAIESPAIKDALRAATDEAVAAGVCGVPSFVARGHL
ncbi:MAG: 2-hydroxychromene-2-carboxylate isomerase, partial [bacterium]|nr:2-hydroxychromene-2-carboxylate isomerase [bacterium]